MLRRLVILMALAWPYFALNPSVAAGATKLLVLGDSLVAGYGLSEQAGYPARLEQALRARGLDVEVINAGVSGDTSSGGLARLDWVLGEDPHAAIVELGANDMLRGIDPAATEKALDAILARLTERKIPVLLAGMLAAPGIGKQYESRFNAIYGNLAAKYNVLHYPFFLDGVAAQRDMLLPDGMHPNQRGVDEMVKRTLPMVLDLVARAAKK